MSKINYYLRPTKHVERKVFVEILTHLRVLGCNVSNYHYMGLGAPYFIDFLLFRKYLYLKKMTSFENDPGLIGRVRFNKPLASINLVEEDATVSAASHVNDKEKYLIWLDYECNLNADILSAIGILSGLLPAGSILIVTVNSSFPPVHDEDRRRGEIDRYMEIFSQCIPGIDRNHITPNKLKNLYAKAIKAEMEKGTLTRTDEEFVQLFNYTYSDGAPMFTFGGIIKEKNDDFNEAVSKVNYVNQKEEPREISVPALTHKERIWLDSCSSATAAKAVKIGLNSDEMKKYFEFASHYPTYYEIAI